MTHFKKTNVKIFAKPSQKVTPDTVYWKQLGVPVHLKEFGPINSIDFSPVEPYYFAVTCSARVQIYNPITKLVHKNLSRFRENAYGGKFRSDGQLLCAGSEEQLVKLFDVHSKSLLRIFRGHTAAVRRCNFTSDRTHIVSFSDDKTVRVWDIPCEEQIFQCDAHDDYVRAGAVSPVSPTVLLSGSYDKKLRMFDTRTKSEPVFTVDHGYPVESVIFLPSGGIFISAGGTELRVWDALAGGRLLARVSQHHKTITSLCLASNNTRLLSGSLDRHVKIYDVSTYKVVHNLDYSNAILSLGVSANDEVLAVGTVDGIVSVQRKEINNTEPLERRKKEGRKSYRYAADKSTTAVNVDSVVPLDKKYGQSKHDAFLRKFQYSKALDSVLVPFVVHKNPHITVSVFQELIRRKGLHSAIAGKEGKSLLVVLRFLLKYLGDYRFFRVLIDVFNVILDVFEEKLENLSPEVIELFKRLHSRIKEEEALTREMLGLSGVIKMFLSASTSNEVQQTPLPAIAPSQSAQQNFVVNIA
ncbi:U3 small nucleolar RNA-associated protein 15 homolog [Cimex lectularius]|uniref:U3 small nucleolar RNA-associated protein 15 homolog n=1 Tax=Cimex lectularius TaxID=79782 RepID=A0A8I6RE21_CIMLE|nr:U3 small nucleolar RNA-associated protein 15 homolog [Cimex lectularius]